MTSISRVFSDYNCLGYSLATRSCVFKNICYSPKNHSFLYYHQSGVTSLPPETFVDSNGTVSWPLELFHSKWKVSLDSTYIHERSRYESRVGEYSFKPVVIAGPTPPNSSWEIAPFMFFTRTRHDDNPGHLVFDFYHPVLTAINSHFGFEYVKNVSTVDHLWRPHSYSRFNGLYEKWKERIGRILFRNQLSYRDFKHTYDLARKGSPPRYQCFEQIIVGCAGIAGLEGHVMHRQASIRYLREQLWKEYAPKRQRFDLSNNADTKRINVLMLHKNVSQWRFNASDVNGVTNWDDIVKHVEAIPNVRVVHIAPYQTEFKDQIQLYRNADITISLWGGISMLNFLMEPGSIEILITSWFKEFMPMPATKPEDSKLICPDFDDRARLSLDNKSLRFCTRDEGLQANHIDVVNFMKLVNIAVKYLRWQAKVASSSSPIS